MEPKDEKLDQGTFRKSSIKKVLAGLHKQEAIWIGGGPYIGDPPPAPWIYPQPQPSVLPQPHQPWKTGPVPAQPKPWPICDPDPYQTQQDYSQVLPKTRYHKDGDEITVDAGGDKLRIGPVTIGFERTLRIPDDGKEYPLPPTLGRFPIRLVSDYADKVPDEWKRHGGIFLPLYQREAMWMSFQGQSWRPNALKIGIGKINAITGESWTQGLRDDPQDYLIVPEQPWLDGINAGEELIKQFVAMPLGMGYTVEGQVSGAEEHGGIQLCLYEPKTGEFPDRPQLPAGGGYTRGSFADAQCFASCAPMHYLTSNLASTEQAEMGLAAGGMMKQKIYEDTHGLETWDQDNHLRLFVHIVNSEMWEEITGEEPPETPVSAKSYTDQGLPWFDLYDEEKKDLKPSAVLQKVSSVREKDAEAIAARQTEEDEGDVEDILFGDHSRKQEAALKPDDNSSVDIPEDQLNKLDAPEAAEKKIKGPAENPLDGEW